MVRRATIVAMVLWVLSGITATSGNLFAQSLDGVYQLEIEDQNSQVISKGTGFYIKPERSVTAYMLTSFHLLNARLLEAAKIKTHYNNKDIYLKIAAYDELNDMLVLSSEELHGQALSFGPDCEGKLSVAGYYKDKLAVLGIEGGFDGSVAGDVKRVPLYLNKGFSGAPLFNDNAQVCGMVILSSEQNASSIAVSNNMLTSIISATGKDLFSVRELRILVGAEKVARTQAELENLILNQSSARQFVIGLAPVEKSQTFIIKDASNLVIDAYSDLSKLLIHRSKNIMVRNINAERLMINESTDVTITGCVFNTANQALLLKGSSSLSVRGNVFKNIDTGIVLKDSMVDEQLLKSDNIFVSVTNTIKNI